jgi:hypothetical protein
METCPEGVFLEIIGTQIWTCCSMLFTVTSKSGFLLPLYGFLGLLVWSFASFCLPLKLELFFSCYTLFICNTSSLYRNKNEKNTEKRKTWEKILSPLWFQKSIQNNQSVKKDQVCSCTAFCSKAQTKVESSRLCPEASKKLYLSWISSHVRLP